MVAAQAVQRAGVILDRGPEQAGHAVREGSQQRRHQPRPGLGIVVEEQQEVVRRAAAAVLRDGEVHAAGEAQVARRTQQAQGDPRPPGRDIVHDTAPNQSSTITATRTSRSTPRPPVARSSSP